MARDLETHVREVEQILLEIKVERDAGEARTDLRKQAIADFDRNYLGIGRIVEAMLRLIGRTEEADRIHPSTRKLDRKG